MMATCSSANIDPTTGQCSSVQWVPQTVVGLPPLTATQGTEISGAIGLLWAIGWLGKVLIKQMQGA